MSPFQGAGAILVEASLADGHICAASIRSSRPLRLTRLFVGRQATEAPELARRLFSLCGEAQAVASRLAVAAAAGAPPEPDALAAEALKLLAERVFESLRASLTSWPWGDDAERSLGRAAAPLRAAAEAARVVASAGEGAAADALGAAIGRLADAAGALGVGAAPGEPPVAATLFGAMRRDCEADDGFCAAPPDALAPADDAAVVAALAKAPEAYSARPTLPGRLVETGAFARLAAASPQEGSALAARLAARLADIRLCLQTMRALQAGAGLEPGALGWGRLGPGLGFGAVESARGRLYHLAGLDAAGRIAAYAILAPTEWNFHASGPFVAALIGARVGEGAAARQAIQRLAALFDPCVAFDVALGEPAHA